ncbi:MAG TPA: histidine kinase dimerization/phospho-acceptor domain-containing protein [Candidatus Baltobacteraceae bacterium]|nr:histidine kinase dimerization/phospho-acceptor domain-containing protein [Candidatus Baltobacteraceae bacterium]
MPKLKGKRESIALTHRLKTSVANIKGFAVLLEQGEFGKVSLEQKKYLKLIIGEADRQGKTIQKEQDRIKLAD